LGRGGLGYTPRRSDDSVDKQALTVYITRPQTNRTTQEHLEKRFGEGNVDGRLQVAQDRAGWSQWSVDYDPLRVTRYKFK